MINTAQFNLITQSMPILQITEYILADHLGSASITTNADGDKTSEVHYTPWGEVLDAWSASASLPIEYTFTGQASYMDDPITSETTEGFGLMFFNARWMDPQLGRFAQADTIIPPGVQGYDHYAYGNNNPIKYTDPTGHFAFLIPMLVGAVIGGTVDAIAQSQNGGTINWGKVAVSAGVGAVAGLAGAVIAPIAAAAGAATYLGLAAELAVGGGTGWRYKYCINKY
jgi:RHS repeat-associated protein